MKETAERRIRILVAAPGIDCHERGPIIIANMLREAGMEVIYLGPWKTPEMIAESAIEEDVDAIALSYALDPLYIVYFPQVVELLKQKGAGDICVFGGGHIAEEHKAQLLERGVTGLYGPGTPSKVIVDHIKDRVKRERWKEAQ